MKTVVTRYNSYADPDGEDVYEDSQGVEVMSDEVILVRNLVDGKTVETIYPMREVLKVQTTLDFDLVEELEKMRDSRETRSKLSMA